MISSSGTTATKTATKFCILAAFYHGIFLKGRDLFAHNSRIPDQVKVRVLSQENEAIVGKMSQVAGNLFCAGQKMGD